MGLISHDHDTSGSFVRVTKIKVPELDEVTIFLPLVQNFESKRKWPSS